MRSAMRYRRSPPRAQMLSGIFPRTPVERRSEYARGQSTDMSPGPICTVTSPLAGVGYGRRIRRPPSISRIPATPARRRRSPGVRPETYISHGVGSVRRGARTAADNALVTAQAVAMVAWVPVTAARASVSSGRRVSWRPDIRVRGGEERTQSAACSGRARCAPRCHMGSPMLVARSRARRLISGPPFSTASAVICRAAGE